MWGQEIRSGSQDPERLDGSDVAVLEVDEPAWDVCVGDSGDYLLEVHRLFAEPYVGEGAARHGVPEARVAGNDVGQVQLGD